MQIKASVLLVSAFTVAPLFTSGCVYGETRQVVRAQFAAELDCPEVNIARRRTFDPGFKEGQYVVRGCGVTRTYSCPAEDGLISYDDKSCTFADGDMSASKKPPLTAPQPAAGDDAMMDEPMDDSAAEPEPEAKPAKGAAKGSAKPSGFKASGNFKVGK